MKIAFNIAYASLLDLVWLTGYDNQVTKMTLNRKIINSEIILASPKENSLRFLGLGFFWTIFLLSILYLFSRNIAIGKAMVGFWGKETISSGFDKLFISAFSNERTQHFYPKIGCKDVDSVVLPEQTQEIILFKELR
ncbi:hypothetical protein DBR43_09920 [Pedobacter sp. KBW06]|uniref:hypothetical protein n=1 Tax=Pedobacter sp. KBW06 TaxID=2153359 RepID=UPI000F5ACDF2|nr:hypothetical protein [Pedobacter sp. KBW06]RQO75644.1 hypothetical protein DBR43_09920 [Pedobacter sp. KBW06]